MYKEDMIDEEIAEKEYFKTFAYFIENYMGIVDSFDDYLKAENPSFEEVCDEFFSDDIDNNMPYLLLEHTLKGSGFYSSKALFDHMFSSGHDLKDIKTDYITASGIYMGTTSLGEDKLVISHNDRLISNSAHIYLMDILGLINDDGSGYVPQKYFDELVSSKDIKDILVLDPKDIEQRGVYTIDEIINSELYPFINFAIGTDTLRKNLSDYKRLSGDTIAINPPEFTSGRPSSMIISVSPALVGHTGFNTKAVIYDKPKNPVLE